MDDKGIRGCSLILNSINKGANMNAEQTFRRLLADVGQAVRNARPGADCPSIEKLAQYVTGRDTEIADHLRQCADCRTVVMRLDADDSLWSAAMEHDPNAALAMALGKKGLKAVRKLRQRTAGSQEDFVSKIKETLVVWASPLWQPMYAGEAVTAADVEVQSKHFEMEYGEYINLSCHWQEEKESEPCIDLSWQANLMQPSKLWARFIDPESSKVLTEIPLGNELEGKICITADQLSFNPTTDKWAIAIIVEE